MRKLFHFKYLIINMCPFHPWNNNNKQRMQQSESSKIKQLTKKWFVMQLLTIFNIVVFSFIVNEEMRCSICSLQFVMIMIMFVVEGTKPYYPLYIIALLAELCSFWWIHKALIAVLIAFILKFQFYEITIVDKGTHNAGFRTIMLGEQQIAVFYPTDQEGEYADWVQTQNFFEVIYDLAFVNPLQYKWVPLCLFKLFTTFMRKVKIPAFTNVALSDCSGQSKYPVILFSHGLSSNLTSHSSYFSWLASRGYIVVSIQHNNDLIRLVYDEPMLKKKGLLAKLYYTSQNHDLQIRREEMETVYQSLISGKLLKQAFPQRQSTLIKSIHFNGHSFGGATCLETLSSLQKKSADLFLVQGVICFDPWFYPLSKRTFNTSFNINITIINSETFMDQVPSEFNMSKSLARIYQSNPNKIQSFVMTGSCHIYCSDTLFACGNGVSIVVNSLNHQSTMTYFSLFQHITLLTIQHQNQKEILKECDEILKQQDSINKDIRVKKQWRIETTTNQNDC